MPSRRLSFQLRTIYLAMLLNNPLYQEANVTRGASWEDDNRYADWSHISDVSNAETSRIQSTDSKTTARARALHHYFQALNAILFGNFAARSAAT